MESSFAEGLENTSLPWVGGQGDSVLAFQACVLERKVTASTAGVTASLMVTWTWSGFTSCTHGFRKQPTGTEAPTFSLACWEAQSITGGTQVDTEDDEKPHSAISWWPLLATLSSNLQTSGASSGDHSQCCLPISTEGVYIGALVEGWGEGRNSYSSQPLDDGMGHTLLLRVYPEGADISLPSDPKDMTIHDESPSSRGVNLFTGNTG